MRSLDKFVEPPYDTDEAWFTTGAFQRDGVKSRKHIGRGHITPAEGHVAATADVLILKLSRPH